MYAASLGGAKPPTSGSTRTPAGSIAGDGSTSHTEGADPYTIAGRTSRLRAA